MPNAVWWLVAASVMLLTITAIRTVATEERDLTERADIAMSQSGLAIDVTFDGRDATLSGVVTDPVDLDRAEALVVDLRGVRTVDVSAVRVTVAHTLDTRISLAYDGTTIVISGIAGSRITADRLIDAANLTFGNGVDDLIVDAAANEPTWTAAIDTLFAGLDGWRSGTLEVTGDGIVISGAIDSAATGERIVSRLSSVTRLDVSYAFDVIGNRTPSFEATVDGDKITLEGELPSQSAIDDIAATADEAFSAVENNLVLASVQAAPWIDVLPDFIRAMTRWDSWHASITGGEGTFDGFAPSTAEVSRIRLQVLPNLGVDWDDLGAEIAPEALAAELTNASAGTITFESASAVLNEESTHVLNGVARALLDNPSTQLTVEGHTDGEGSDVGNLRLSKDRADAVVDYLVEAGVSADRLTTVGFGETRPIAENGTTIGREQNRRIEFVVRGEANVG